MKAPAADAPYWIVAREIPRPTKVSRSRKGLTMIDESDARAEAPELNGRRAVVAGGGTTRIGRAIAVLLAS